MADPRGIGSRDLLITNARVIDGTGALPSRDLRTIRIEDGCIAEIADNLPAGAARTGTRVLDAEGATIMPGLIDGHVHLQSVPGSAYRDDSEDRLEQLRFHHLRAYLACGVTTVLDCAISAPTLRGFSEHLASGGVGPRICALAPALYTPGGYLDSEAGNDLGLGSLGGGVSTKADVEARFDAFDGLDDHVVGMKVFLEPGQGFVRTWPVHSPELQRFIAAQAARRNLPVYVHATRPKETRAALQMGAHCLCHGAGPLKGTVADAKAHGVYATTTVAGLFEQILAAYQPARLDDELVRLAVPEVERAAAADPATWRRALSGQFTMVSPAWWPPALVNPITKVLYAQRSVRSIVKVQIRSIIKMRQAGIPVALGSDCGLLLAAFEGPSTIREIELLGEAGMPAMDVLISATRVPAEMMGIDHLVGTVAVGKRADLIMVAEDPLTDLSALRRSILYTIRDGEARTPQQWMRDGGAPMVKIRRKLPGTGEGTWRRIPVHEEAPSSPTPAS